MSGDWDGAAADIFRAIRIESPHELTLAGRKFTAPAAAPSPPGLPAPGGAPAAAQAPLLGRLSNVLYHHVYSRSFSGRLAEPAETSPEDYSFDPELTARLAAANGSRDRWEHGWQIGQVLPMGQVLAQRGAAQRTVWPGQFLSKDGPGARPRPGSQVSLFYPKESVSLQPGFYYVFGETPEEESHGFGLVRAYWNVDAAGAPRLVRLLSERLNRFHVPFRFKCSVVLSQFERTDVAVIYLVKRFFPVFADLLCDIHPQVRDSLAEAVPLFAKPLAAGVGIAEDPGNGESFGQHRCRILAETLWNCFLNGNQSLSARLSELGRLLGVNGVDARQLHLNAGSLDWYELPAGLA
ncbi:MAG TPA: T3SS effector HopA1 family protein [Thermoanaerobaculia bacterium]|nr:T3SS effector HopA1 family protein [Thermoanaerobaculia bacterium]